MPLPALTDQFQRPHKREASWLAAAGVFVLAASLAALGSEWWRIGVIGEWATYMVLAFVMLSWRPIRSAFARIGRFHKSIVVLCFLLLAFGQFIGGGRQAYPLSRFQMFTDPQQVRLYQYLGRSSTGDSVTVNPAGLFRSLDRGRFYGKLENALEAAIEDGPGSPAARTYDAFLTAILERYNADARVPIVRLEVYAFDAPLDPPPRDRVAVDGVRVWSVEAGK